MIFETKKYIVRRKRKRTSANGFKDLNIGDVIQCSLDLQNTTKPSYRGGNYAIEVLIKCDTLNTSWKNTQNQFVNNILNFDLEEL